MRNPFRIVYNHEEHEFFNGSQLAKMKKYIPYMSLPQNLEGRSSWSKKLQLCFKNYYFCEYVKFEAIFLKFDYIVNTFIFKIAKFEFKETVHYSLWAKSTQL